MECGVDSIVIGDIGLLYAYHEKDIELQFMPAFTLEQSIQTSCSF